MGSFWITAAEDPDRLAIVEDGGEQVTYGQLACAANSLANGFRRDGLERGDTVACMMSNRWEFIALLLATHQVGLVLAPVNRHLASGEAAYILRNSGARRLVTDSAVEHAQQAAEIAGLAREARFSVDELEGFRPFAELLGEPTAPADRVAGTVMFYSSGTTGKPKGIRRPLVDEIPEENHEAVSSLLKMLELTEDGVHLTSGPLYHGAPLQHTNVALQIGQTVVLTSGFEPEHALGLIEKFRVNDAFMVPTMLHRLTALSPERRAKFDVSSVRKILVSGAPCPAHVKEQMIAWWGEVFTEFYGASESGMVTYIDSAEWLRHQGSVGRARPGAEIKICDALGTQLPVGEIGLLHLRSNVVISYHGDEEKTAQSHRDGFFIPGDMGWLDDEGYLHLADRRTDLIISGGVNIYPAEIEAELLAHADVEDAVVFGVPDPEWGHAVAAWIELRDPELDEVLFLASLSAHCERRLARYKVPRIVRVIPEIPRTPAGKVARARVREAHLTDGAVASS